MLEVWSSIANQVTGELTLYTHMQHVCRGTGASRMQVAVPTLESLRLSEIWRDTPSNEEINEVYMTWPDTLKYLRTSPIRGCPESCILS